MAEMGQDEAEARCREAEGLVEGLREDCDAAHEELAFRESELEETKLELEVERERHRMEVEDMQQEIMIAGNSNSRSISTGSNNNNENGTVTSVDNDDFLSDGDDSDASKEDDDYVKRLEDELELVTEQLIETEQRLTQAEDKIASFANQNQNQQDANKQTQQSETKNAELKQEMLKVKEDHHQKEEQILTLKEELELAQEELGLVQEELKAAEEDVGMVQGKMDALRSEHRDELAQLRSDLESAQTEARSSVKELETLEETIQSSIQETSSLRDEIDRLNIALDNAKQDHSNVVEELEQVNSRFDEVRQEAHKSGFEAAKEEVQASLADAHQTEVADLKKQFKDLQVTNQTLQQQIDSQEMAVAAANDSKSGAQDETVKKLQDQLARNKEELQKKEQEAEELKNALETRVTQAEMDVTRLEKELSQTKGKLAEAEANLIVTKREQAQSKSLPKQSAATASKPTSADESDSEVAASRRNMRIGSTRRSRSTSPVRNLRLQLQLQEEEKKVKELQKEIDTLKDQHRMAEAHKKQIESDLKALQSQLFAGDGDAPVTTQMSRLSAMAAPKTAMDNMGENGDSIEDIIATGDVEKISEELKSLNKKAASQREYNAQLLSKILSLQGNIQVCCRIRPIRMHEIQKGYKNVVESLSETELGCFDHRNQKWKSFAFDKVWGPDQTQSSIFQDVEPLALSVVDGFNACIFAYGQTGSGKTYTMEGTDDGGNYGISYRTIQKVFTLLNLRVQQQKAAVNAGGDGGSFSFKMQIGMLEIYNDEIYDLLGPIAQAGDKEAQKREAKKLGIKATLDIRRSAEGSIEVPNLTKEPVESIKDVMDLLKKGNKSRSTAATDMNEHSSRSHMVLAVEVKSGLGGQPGNNGVLYLVDLAGSERVRKSKVEGEQLKEATHINKSLSALGNVMEALDRKASHVPYRDSKLTYLLQDSLGGNSRTMMVVTCCPHENAFDESVHALQFATRVRRIQIGAAQRNVTSKNLEETVKNLTNEMKSLMKSKEKSEGQLSSLKRDNTRIQEKLQSISKHRSQTQSDSRTLDVLRKNNNEMAGRWQKEKTLRERAQEELEKSKTGLRKKEQECAKINREKEMLGRKLEEKENQLTKTAKDLREAKDAANASNLRARKAQIVASRAKPIGKPATPTNKKATVKPKPTPAVTVVPPVTAGVGQQ